LIPSSLSRSGSDPKEFTRGFARKDESRMENGKLIHAFSEVPHFSAIFLLLISPVLLHTEISFP
jgi:hypothetical protein